MKKKTNTLKITSALIGASVIMAGAGLGVGYAIWHSPNNGNENEAPVVQCNVMRENNAVLGGVGHVAGFQFTLNKAYEAQVAISVRIDETYANLLRMDDSGLISWSNGRTWIPGFVVGESMPVIIEKGQTTANIYIIQNSRDTFSEQMKPIHFTFKVWYGDGAHPTYIPQIDENIMIYLYNDHVVPVLDPNAVSGLSINFGEIFDNDPLESGDFVTYIPTKFKGLPTIDDPISFANNATWGEVIPVLQKYDNAESMACLILADYVLTLITSDFSNGSGLYWLQYENYSKLTVELYNISLSSGAKVGTETSRFNICFESSGYENKNDIDEIPNAIFNATDENFGAVADAYWRMLWSSIYNIDGRTMQLEEDGNCVGLQLRGKEGYNGGTVAVCERNILKEIYKGVVSTWPWWF